MTTLDNSAELDLLARRHLDGFGQLMLLAGLAVAAPPRARAHRLHPQWDDHGRLAYGCEPACGQHHVLALRAHRWAWLAFCDHTGLPPYQVDSPRRQRALLLENLSSVVIDCRAGNTVGDPIAALHWRSVPATSPRHRVPPH
jgi:hypothetical protein